MPDPLALPPQETEISTAALHALQDSVEAARAGETAVAAAALDAAVAHDPELPSLRLVTAQIRYAAGHFQRALDDLDHASRQGAARQADELRYNFTSQLGWTHEAREVVERRLEQPGADEALWRGRAARLYGRLRDHAAATRHIERLIAISRPTAALHVNAAHLASLLGDHAGSRRHTLEAVRLDGAGTLHAGAALLLAEGGSFDEARRLAEGSGQEGEATLAQIELWAGNLEAAAARAETVLAADPRSSAALRIRGAVALLRGDPSASIAALDASLREDPELAETYVWRAEARLRRGELERVSEDVHRAFARSDRFLFAAWVLWLLATLGARDGRAPSRHTLIEVEEGCAEVYPETREIFARGDRAEVIRALEGVLSRLGGNRGDRPTWIEAPGSIPRPLRVRANPRFACRLALDHLRIAPASEVLDELSELSERFSGSALPLAHRGEANLWLGRYAAARHDLEHALDVHRYTRWAYIGLTLLEVLEGRPERGLETSALGVQRMGSTGRAVYAHRGEAYLRLGRLPDAIEDLETACRLNPSRLGAKVVLALAYGRAGRDESSGALHGELAVSAPGLLSDAALAAGIADWQASLDPEARARLLESALSLMRGNRSSGCQTYVTAAGTVRTAPMHGRAMAAARADRLERFGRWLSVARSTRKSHGPELCRDVEQVAFDSGLRAAIRLALAPAEVATLRRRYEARGAVTLASRMCDVGAVPHQIVIVAGDADTARVADAAERANDPFALGRLLGYPSCCVHRFAQRSESRMAGSPYAAARDAWVPHPEPRLNNLLFGLGLRLISFEPCRYDCPEAVATADAIVQALRRSSPSSASRLKSELARPVAIDSGNARALVELEGGDPRRIRSAEPIPSYAGRAVDAAARLLAARLHGATVGLDGTVELPDDPTVCVVDFGWATRRGGG